MPGAAARLGDTTAHGGSIVVGCPTVLVGGAPAARATDMHACPMVTPGVPPIPHVGGPLLPGVPTVLIANLPASCLGDMAICVGPPDSVVKGEFTVLVGTGGGGGAGMGGASGAIAGASASGVAHPTGSQPQATALGDGRYEARLGALRFVGAVEFVAVALRAVATLRAHETGRAALRVLRDRRAEVTIAEGERGASVRVADGRVTVSVRFAPIASRDDLDAHGLALETLLWVADDVFAKGAPHPALRAPRDGHLMARVETAHGSFEAPDGWTLMEGLGAVGCTPDEMAAATSPHPSMVLTGDVRDEGVGPRGYVDAQLAALGNLLPDWRAIDESVPETEPGPAVVRHSFQPPDVGWMVQFQAYWFHEARVSILTMTTPSALIHQAWETFAAAVGTFSAAPAQAAQ